MITIKLNNKGQITIPAEIRSQFGLHSGDEIVLVAKENYLIVYKAKISVNQNGLSAEEKDETAYLLSSPVNAERMHQAKKQIENGQLIEVENIDDLDKMLS